jgi:hypothetical protein
VTALCTIKLRSGLQLRSHAHHRRSNAAHDTMHTVPGACRQEPSLVMNF